MASAATENWWSTFLDAQGRDSEEEAAFVGYLTTKGISADATPDVLQGAYGDFHKFMEESEKREADPGPDRATMAAEKAVKELEQQFVAKSRVSAPGVEKPMTAVTRPAETRKPLADTAVPPTGEAQLAPAPESEEPPPSPEPVQRTMPPAPEPAPSAGTHGTRPEVHDRSAGSTPARPASRIRPPSSE